MLCHKCKVNQPFEDDSWCLSCSAWESIGSDLVGRWDVPGLRDLACEAVIATARHLKGLRRISAGLASRQVASGTSSGARERNKRGIDEALAPVEPVKTEAGERSPLPRSRSRPEPTEESRAKVEKDESSEYEEIDEEEESENLPGAKRISFPQHAEGGSSRPPEPKGPPPGASRDGHRGRTDPEVHHKKREEKRSKEKKEKGDRKRKHRGGRKHKRLSRLAEDPSARVHRSLDNGYWSRPPRDVGGFTRHS